MVKGFIAVAIAVVLCVGLAVFGWLSIHNISTTPFLYFFGSVIGPVLGILWTGYKTTKVGDNVEEVRQQVETVSHQTNGALTERIQNAVNEALSRHQETVLDAAKDAVKDTIKEEMNGGGK
jgi:hypothetical protein